ncbi:hypothetical protein BEP19_12840 [Ammoniphilus oxalaticus]|uniref:Glycosyl transferase family 1 domain-containing protein n=1 Tax=Ammoniphilus oxalaticus TaxID=66863 RepID=A0A419SH95_9BACL|nr:glycosyltransferase family 4 protein [Ammoniphilus oxalaticus]RKD23105.1 hypothetical protein BEP19_12840 [Ammoniphilus oxalaticus]
MKILYICSFYHRAMIFKDCMDALTRRGNTVQVYNATWKGDSVEKKYVPIMTDSVVHKECYFKWERYFFFTKQYKIYRNLVKNFDLLNFDILHAHNLFNGGVSAYYCSKKTNVPFIVSIRASDITAFMNISFFRKLAKKVLKSAAGIQFLSIRHRDEFLNNYVDSGDRDLIEAKSFIAFNGLEEFWLKNRHNPKTLKNKKNITLLFAGKINKNKNILKIVEASNLLINRGYNVNLRIVGKVLDGEIGRRLREIDYVELIDFKPMDELINLYRESDIFIMPSIHESFGRVYAEAMTQGLPVIYTKGQGFDGIFSDGEVGYAVPSGDAEYISQCIERITTKYEQISKNCIDRSQKFDWKRISKDIDEFYKKVIS